jgi:fructose-bisphosphate aldolase, class I
MMRADGTIEQRLKRNGFVAALDQSGGSTPSALLHYGILASEYASEEEMFRLMHEMRKRIMTAPSFNSAKILAAILFERTMDDQVRGRAVPTFLWEERGVVPFVKIDKGLGPEKDGVRLMNPIPGLDALLARAAALGVVGTKMRSFITHPSQEGIAAIVAQQFDLAAQISERGLLPIIEPEVSIGSPDKTGAEAILLKELTRKLDALPAGRRVILKLTIPDVPDFYASLMSHERVVRVLALSGGYSRVDACRRLARDHGMIASFSRALLEDLRRTMTDDEFDRALSAAVDQIYRASTEKE